MNYLSVDQGGSTFRTRSTDERDRDRRKIKGSTFISFNHPDVKETISTQQMKLIKQREKT